MNKTNLLRHEVRAIYKTVRVQDSADECVLLQLVYLGREYPKGADWFLPRLKRAFLKNANVQSE